MQHRWFTEPERQILLQHMYERATKGWKKTIPLLDFKEDLKVFEEVHKYKTDVISPNCRVLWLLTILQADMMPPPKKQASSNKRPGPRDISRDEEHHLRLQVSREQSGFRSAKSFGKSIEGEKRKLRG